MTMAAGCSILTVRAMTFGRATLATCAALLHRPEWLVNAADSHEQAVWWLGPDVLHLIPAARNQPSVFFPDSGVAVMTAGAAHIVMDAGPFGTGGAGHSHADTLSLVVRRESEDILLDPGTYTYISDPAWRNAFRGSAAHNTIACQRPGPGHSRWSLSLDGQAGRSCNRVDIGYRESTGSMRRAAMAGFVTGALWCF